MTELQGVAGVPATPERHFDIRFRLDLTDYRQLMKQIRWTAVERIVGMLPWIALGSLSGLIGIFVSHLLEKHISWLTRLEIYAYAFGIIGVSLWLIYVKIVLPAYLQATLSGQRVGMGETHMIVDADGVFSELAGLKSNVAWSLIDRVIESEQHVILMYSRLAGFVVPKRVFATSEEAARFVAFTRSQATAAH